MGAVAAEEERDRRARRGRWARRAKAAEDIIVSGSLLIFFQREIDEQER
jgi:hypothetical protein